MKKIILIGMMIGMVGCGSGEDIQEDCIDIGDCGELLFINKTPLEVDELRVGPKLFLISDADDFGPNQLNESIRPGGSFRSTLYSYECDSERRVVAIIRTSQKEYWIHGDVFAACGEEARCTSPSGFFSLSDDCFDRDVNGVERTICPMECEDS